MCSARTAPGTDDADIDLAAINRTVGAAARRESAGPRDMRSYLGGILAGQPEHAIIGPLLDGSGASGVVVHRDRTVATWGDPTAVEMSFSATKSYLSLVAGLAFDRGLVPDPAEPVATHVDDAAFSGARNERITWSHLLRQTSQWDGTLWGKPWWCDPQGKQSATDELGAPGSAFAYNDVRINLLALALTRVFGRSLEDVLRDELMRPIGATDDWSWHGYATSATVVDGESVAVVSGGAHWGGGVWMRATDHARVGQLLLRHGDWDGRRVLSDEWIRRSFVPGDHNPDYGLLWWLNRRGAIFPEAPVTGVCARGNASRQLLWIDPARALVVVSRWTDGVGPLLRDLSAAIPAA